MKREKLKPERVVAELQKIRELEIITRDNIIARVTKIPRYNSIEIIT